MIYYLSDCIGIFDFYVYDIVLEVICCFIGEDWGVLDVFDVCWLSFDEILGCIVYEFNG